MIELPFYLQFSWILEKLLLVMILGYTFFSILIVRQISVLVSNVKTNLTNAVYAVGFLNLAIALLALVASAALAF